MLRRMLEDILLTEDFASDCVIGSSAEIADLYSRHDTEVESHSGSKSSVTKDQPDVTAQAKALAADNLHADIDDLSHYFSKLDRSAKRRSTAIGDQDLERGTALRYEVAGRRGVVCLILQY